jgi:hypothetical protein
LGEAARAGAEARRIGDGAEVAFAGSSRGGGGGGKAIATEGEVDGNAGAASETVAGVRVAGKLYETVDGSAEVGVATIQPAGAGEESTTMPRRVTTGTLRKLPCAIPVPR